MYAEAATLLFCALLCLGSALASLARTLLVSALLLYSQLLAGPSYGLDVGCAEAGDADGALRLAHGEKEGCKRGYKFRRFLSRAAAAGFTTTRIAPGEWACTPEHRRILWLHAASHNPGAAAAAAVYAGLCMFMHQPLVQLHMVEWRAANGELCAFCTLLVTGRSLVGGVYACDPAHARGSNLWQCAAFAALTLMAKQRCEVCNLMSTYAEAKRKVGMTQLPLRRALSSLWKGQLTEREPEKEGDANV